MKKLIILLFVTLFGCEMYEMETYPSLSGEWKLMDVALTNGGSVPGGTYHTNLNDTIILQDYYYDSFNDGVITFKQRYDNPSIAWCDKFIVGVTIWEFETNLVGIPTTKNGIRGYEHWSYYSINRDLITSKWTGITITDHNRHINIVECGANVLRFSLPKTWTMFKLNTNIEFFFYESITLTFVRV